MIQVHKIRTLKFLKYVVELFYLDVISQHLQIDEMKKVTTRQRQANILKSVV